MDVIFRFVWVLLVFHGFVKSLDFEIFKTQKEEEVKSMAAAIVALDKSRCDFVSHCPCSRHSCTPIDGSANYDFVCQKTEESYKYCRAYTPKKQSQCNLQVNYARSYFRVAPSASNHSYQIPNEIPKEMCSTICMTSGFENVFSRTFENPVNRSYGETYYFGSADGVQRVYPGLEEPQNDEDGLCGLYDPRKRPWLIDDAHGKNQQISNLTLEIGKITTAQRSVPSSLDGFIQAVFTATANNKYENYFQVMLLLTNGEFASTANNSSVMEKVSETLTNNSINLFIYCIDSNPNLQSLAKQSHGHFELLNNSYFENPLYQISSYFNFMALVRKNVDDTPFWTNFYSDSEGRGRIITVSYQAVSKKGYLLGVAAIDLMNAVFENLPDVMGDRPQYHNASLNVIVKATDTGCNVTCDVLGAVCPRNSSKTFAELNCCNTCPLSKEKDHGRKWIVIFVAVAAVILVIIAFAFTILRVRKRKRNPTFNISATSTDLGPYQ